MATQSPTPRGFQRPLWSVAAIGLSALLGSCESEQTGYEVAVPLIGPIEFSETSCEFSGDVCETDADCEGERCVPTLEPFEPVTYGVSLSPAAPSFTLPPLADTRGWTSLLVGLQNTDGNPLALTTQNFSVTNGPITLSVRPFSRNGLYFGRDAGYNPQSVSECTFTLENSSTGEDYTSGILNCLTAWVRTNGAPLEFDMEVTSSAGAGTFASASPKSGFGPKQQPPNYSLVATDNWEPTDMDCRQQVDDAVLDAVGEGADFFEFLNCENLMLGGSGMCTQPITLWGVATVYDPCGNTAVGSLGRSINDSVFIEANRTYTVTVYPTPDVVVEENNDVPVVFDEDAESFIELFFTAGAGECLDGEQPPPGAVGFAAVDWKHCYAGTEDPIPERDGDIVFEATGFCPVTEGTGGTGATNGSGQ
jgi:hypothetical protein